VCAKTRGATVHVIKPLHYTLSLDVDLAAHAFSAEATIAATTLEPLTSLVLRCERLAVDAVSVDGRPATFDVDGQELRIDTNLPADRECVVRVTYRGAIGESWRGFFMSGACAVTQLQPAYAPRLFPCVDEPAWKTPFDLTVVASTADTVVANAPLLTRETVDGRRQRWTFATSPPLPVHLFGLAVGPFEVAHDGVEGIRVRLFAPPGSRRQDAVLTIATRLLVRHAATLGVPYPWPKLDLVIVPDYEAAAIETTAALYFRESAVHVAAESGTAGPNAVTGLVAHELAHQWFGSLVSPASWCELWLSEGFATWLADKVTADEVEVTRGTRAAMAADSLAGSRALRSTSAAPDGLHELYDAIAYRKGAAILRMLEAWLGEPAFLEGARVFLTRHAGATAVSEDLWTALAETSGLDVAAVALPLTDLPRVPQLTFEWSGSTVRISRGGTSPLPVTVRAGLAGGVIETRRLLMEGSADLEMPDDVSWVFGNVDATGYYRCSYADSTAIPAAALSDAEAITLLCDTFDAMWEGTSDTIEFLRVAKAVGDRPGVAHTANELVGELSRLLAGGERSTLFRAWVERAMPSVIAPALDKPSVDVDPDRPWRRDQVLARLEQQLANPASRQEAWIDLSANWDRLEETVVTFGGRGALTALAAVADVAMRDQIATFFSTREIAGGKATLRNTLAVIDSRIAFREREQPIFDAWLVSQSGASGGVTGGSGVAHALLNTLAAGFQGALLHREWLERRGVPVPEWMQPAADLTRVVKALEHRLLNVFRGVSVIEEGLRDLTLRLREDLHSSADMVEHLLAEGHERAAPETAHLLAATLARQSAVHERMLRSAIAFSDLSGLAGVNRALRTTLRATEAERSRVKSILAQRFSEDTTSEARRALWSACTDLPRVQRSHAADLRSLWLSVGQTDQGGSPAQAAR
jgi:puromycin-sensitive aminopeptidase